MSAKVKKATGQPTQRSEPKSSVEVETTKRHPDERLKQVGKTGKRVDSWKDLKSLLKDFGRRGKL